MPSMRYVEMQKRITALRHAMLPSRFDATGLYPERVHQRAAAFRLLAHAEFESFVEDIVTGHVAARIALWTANRKPSITLATLIAYDEVGGKPATSLVDPGQKGAKLFPERLRDAAQRFNHQVRMFNHGVREINILNMVLPIGLEASEIDLVWLERLDGWAQERGDFAHKSSGKIGIRLDPATEYAQVKVIMLGFKDLDRRVASLP